MDTKVRNREGETRSSDEEEAFESADEGEKGTGAGEEQGVATSTSDTEYSTLKKSVGKTDPTLKEPAYTREEANFGTAQCVNNSTRMDHDGGIEDEEKSKEASMEDSQVMAPERPLGLSKSDENETQSVKEHTDIEIFSFPKKDEEITADEVNKENIISKGDKANDEVLPQSADNDPEERLKSTLTPREGDKESKQHMVVHPQLEQPESLSNPVEHSDRYSLLESKCECI